MTHITIYPLSKINYYTFYLEGLQQVLGRPSIAYSTSEFPTFHHHCLAFIVDGPKPMRVYLSAGDGPGFNEAALEWCDVYGKINIDPDCIPSQYQAKIVSMGPSFGVRAWSLPQTIWRAVRSYALARDQIEQTHAHFANYYAQYRFRLPLSMYKASSSEDGYVFFASSLWKKETATNALRADFIEICRSMPEISFEGGFAPRKHHDVPGYEHLQMDKRLGMSDYLVKTKKSMLVFSTAAVQNCLSWHFAEFLALGKAIISTPITRLMPAPIVHGKHIHVVDGSRESIEEAVILLSNDSAYRSRLEKGAAAYYAAYLRPQVVIQRVLSAAEANVV